MLRYVDNASLFESQADVLVNTVNCVGAMGKGIAKEFARRFPEIIPPYRHACSQGSLRPGGILMVGLTVRPTVAGFRRPAVLMLATKDDWRGRSRIEWIEHGLREVRLRCEEWGVGSIAMPQVGCGLGGLDWSAVRPLVESILADTVFDVTVYLHSGEQIRTNTMQLPLAEEPQGSQRTDGG